jgi:hypothetical protein
MAVGNKPNEGEEQQRILFLQRLEQIFEEKNTDTFDLQYLGEGAVKQTFKLTANETSGASAALSVVYVSSMQLAAALKTPCFH